MPFSFAIQFITSFKAQEHSTRKAYIFLSFDVDLTATAHAENHTQHKNLSLPMKQMMSQPTFLLMAGSIADWKLRHGF